LSIYDTKWDVLNAQTNIYLGTDLTSLTIDLETDYFYYDYTNNILNCKLFKKFRILHILNNFIHPPIINEYKPRDISANRNIISTSN
jgi:hypothetical protein